MLLGARRAGGAWRPIEAAPDGRGGVRARSDALGLELHAEPQRLRFRDPRTGLWLPDHDDTSHALDQTRRERDDTRHALDDTRHALDDTRRERDAEAAARRDAEARAAAAEAEVAALRARLNDRNGGTGS
ncbi:MAG: hypothetical protein OXG47_10155, partial [bacterium]|nr:hypothetical protein [bacterium]